MVTKAQQAAVDALDSQVEEIRHQAVRRLPEVFEDVPGEVLLKALGDSSWRVRKAAAQLALDAPADDRVLDALVAALGAQDNAGLRNAATEVLVQIGPPAVEPVSRLLRSGDSDERKFAADILGEIGQPEATDALLAALEDADENVRGAAAEALGRLGQPAVAERLYRQLERDGLLVQLSCLDALARLEAQPPLAQLESLLAVRPLRPHLLQVMGGIRRPDERGRIAVHLAAGLEARSRAERAAAVQGLVRQAEAADARGRVEIQTAVARTAGDVLLERLRDLLASGRLEERRAAVALLGWTGRVEVVGELIRAAAEEPLRQPVQQALQIIGEPAVGPLVELLDELGRTERVLAVELLGHFQHPAGLERIIELCLDDDPEVAEAAQRALGRQDDPAVIPTLIGLLARDDAAVAAGAASSLIQLGSRHHDAVLAGLEPLLEADAGSARSAAVHVLCETAHRGDAGRLERLVGDQDPEVRAAACQALGRVGGPDADGKLRMLLADESSRVRAAAGRALGLRDGPEARQALQVALRDEEPWVVAESLAGIGQGRAGWAPEAILPFAEHGEPAVALEAVRALNRLGWAGEPERLLRIAAAADPEVHKELLAGCGQWPIETARRLLERALDDARWDVRKAAVEAIGALGDEPSLDRVARRRQGEPDPLVREVMDRVLRTASGRP
jgi:HEAT repeat protein